MSNITNWLKIVQNNELHAYNRVSNRDTSICFNFLQIPDTTTVALTVTIMKNKVKKNSLDPQNFAKIMSCIESSLNKVSESIEKPTEPEHFVNVKNLLTNSWYLQLCCHRVFFIPEFAMFDTIKELFNQSNIRSIKNCNLEEVSVLVNTDNFDFNAKFY